MNDCEKPNLLLKSLLICIATLMIVVGFWFFFVVNQKNTAAQLLGPLLVQAGIVIGFGAYKPTRPAVTDPANEALLKQRARLSKALTIGMGSASFMVTPIVLAAVDPKLPAFIFWYSVATGFVGLMGLVWVFVWFKKSSN